MIFYNFIHNEAGGDELHIDGEITSEDGGWWGASGQIVARCIADGCVLETLPLETYRSYSELFEGDLYHDIDLTVCVEKRISEGGTSAASVDAQIAYVKEQLGGGNV